MFTYIRSTNGTTIIAPDGTQSGYEYSRDDIPTIRDIHIQLPHPYYVHVRIGSTYLYSSHKYIRVNHHNSTVKIGKYIHHLEHFIGTEKAISTELYSLMTELLNDGRLYGTTIPYVVSVVLNEYSKNK